MKLLLLQEIMEEGPRNFYRDHVKNIPEAILLIQYDILYVDNKIDNNPFSEKELNILFRYEYKRRKIYDKMKKVSFVSQDISSGEGLKMQIYQMVTLWINALYEANFKLERLNTIN